MASEFSGTDALRVVRAVTFLAPGAWKSQVSVPRLLI
jgi:hypothetical protein